MKEKCLHFYGKYMRFKRLNEYQAVASSKVPSQSNYLSTYL